MASKPCQPGCTCGRHRHVVTPEARAKISATLKGRPLSAQHRAALTGRRLSEQHKAAISESQRRRHQLAGRARLTVGAAALRARDLPARSTPSRPTWWHRLLTWRPW